MAVIEQALVSGEPGLVVTMDAVYLGYGWGTLVRPSFRLVAHSWLNEINSHLYLLE